MSDNRIRPNAETIKAMHAARNGELLTFGSVAELLRNLHSDKPMHRTHEPRE